MPMNYNAPRRTNESKIAKYRIDAGITQAKLANILGITQATVSHWENGSIPRKKSLLNLAKLFKCNISDLI